MQSSPNLSLPAILGKAGRFSSRPLFWRLLETYRGRFNLPPTATNAEIFDVFLETGILDCCHPRRYKPTNRRQRGAVIVWQRHRRTNAIDNLAKEKSPNMFPLHVHKIISGVQEIGRRLGELENRVKALEAKK
jgi:hypothetical protein